MRDGNAAKAAPVLELRGVGKTFGGARALTDVDFTLAAGEVHAVVGLNGAGKSTLVETMCGALVPDGGTVHIDGRRHTALTPRRAHAAGVRIVHQKRSLVPGLTVAENLLLGRLPTRFGVVDWRRAHRTAADALADLGIEIATDRTAAGLAPAERTLVEIAREAHLGGRALVLDEPTASLGGADAARVHRLVRALRSRGTGVVYISHDLDEVLDLADRITVLRDGHRIVTVAAADADLPALIGAMVGDRLVHETDTRDGREADVRAEGGRAEGGRARVAGEPVLELSGLSAGRLREFDLKVHGGQVTAVVGPVGDGQSELFPLLSGLRRAEAGRVRVNGRDVPSGDVGAALGAGLRCVTGDRLAYGLVPELTVDENLDLVHRGLRRPRLVRWRELRERARAARDRYGVTAVHADPPVAALSGGNQQKTLLAAWLDTDMTACLLEEPTGGVDVAAKADIHRIVGGLAASGTAVLLASGDVDEVVGLADRVVVVRAGRTVADRPIDQVTRDELVALTAGGRAA
ncbi:ribose transport system ATP-binding protein/rhamnose transport system ATP-binding protein [Actinomadura pelletieri DSM 43383]|uniref:Ribose transport system ATP-binding protein/rhamnose transport system ATP-binding protein n=1 Tax=Actinomadura pelletieri DSM 43383 TaxID=1120940 RepID=A0A495QL26_9ACTN|nr:sugar ABC transporter ATP-binding protein [Actinomadura pelletieri]RKS73208.1 ribose transport system ATP-binding protein/rhamnose transport system ATP-binding protein [Actinomadura pelletieri DSM 43383]